MLIDTLPVPPDGSRLSDVVAKNHAGTRGAGSAARISLDLLSITEIRRRLTTSSVGAHLFLYGEVESTNATMRTLARGGLVDGSVVLAESQTAGRSRRGTWFSPSGVNLYASVLFRPVGPPRELGVFTFVASLALVDALKDHGVAAAIKWPNDVLVEGKKIGGVLVEAALRGDAVDHVVVGVGINLNVEVAELRAALGPAGRFATSLAAECGHAVDRNAFTASYLNYLDQWVGAWCTEGAYDVLAAWRDRDILTGRRVEVRGATAAFEGRVLGVDAAGALIVLDFLGTRRSVTSAEIRMLN